MEIDNMTTAITGKTRSEIRYALYRVKTGNPDSQHEAIYDHYQTRLDKMGLGPAEFAERWDVKKEDTDALVAGAMVAVYNEEIHASLFDEEGALKEF
jgi:hypothetical protein